MAATITVVAEAPPGGRGVHRLVESIDSQSLPASEFDVLFLVGDRNSEIARRLADLSDRRPNVRVLESGGTPAIAAVEHSSGDWLVYLPADVLRTRVRLRPEALARLTDFAAGADCDLVLARTDVADGALAHDLVLEDAPRVAATVQDVAAATVLVQRREFAADHGVVVDAESAARSVAGTDRIGTFGSYPCADLEDAGPASSALSLRVARATASWRDGSLLVSASGSAGGGAGRVRFSVRDTKSGLEFWLPGEGTAATDGSFSGSATLDVRTAAFGAPLTEGVWQVRVGVHGDVHRWSPRGPLPRVSLSAAVVDGMLVAAPTGSTTLTIDVGATRFSPIGGVDPSDVRIREGAQGTHLVAELPGIAVEGNSRTVGSVLLDKFPLRAELIAENGRARLECYLSGLSGDSAVATRFGRSKAAPTGLRLEISPVGMMSVRRATAAERSTARPSATGRHSDSTGGSSLARRARRQVPARLEPVVQALSRNPTARRMYRRFTGD